MELCFLALPRALRLVNFAAALMVGLCVSAPLLASASVNLIDSSGWKVQVGGFAEADLTYDSRPSYLEVIGNLPVTGADSLREANFRKGLSVRNSRASFLVLPPGQETWRPKLVFEFDLLGNRQDFPLWGASDTYYTDPSLRFRHYFASVDHEGWVVTAGKAWTLFGWNPYYGLTTVSVSPGPGSLSHRTKQVTAIRKYSADNGYGLELGLSFEGASQSAGGAPNVNFGIRLIDPKVRAGFASASGDAKPEPMSLALSYTMRKFSTGAPDALSPSLHKVSSGALALDTLIPLIKASDAKSPFDTLVLTAEYTAGTGYGDNLAEWSGNLPEFPATGATQATVLRRGIGGFDSAGGFHLFSLQSWNSQLQYHFGSNVALFATVGHSELLAMNLSGLGPVSSGQGAYDKASMNFVNLFHDFSPQTRAAVEYAGLSSHYLDGTTQLAERYQLSVYYRY